VGVVASLCGLLACGGGGSGDGDSTAATEGDDSGTATEAADDSSGDPPPVPVGLVRDVLVPFDPNAQDLDGPGGWSTQYGKSPEIVAVAHGRTIDVLVQNYETGPTGSAFVLRLEPFALEYVVTSIIEAPVLDRIMGFARDPNDNLYVASGAQEADVITL